MKKNVLIATGIVVGAVLLVSAALYQAVKGTHPNDDFGALLFQTWDDAQKAPLGSLVEGFLGSCLAFGIGIAILCFADYGVIAILLLGAIGIAGMISTVAGFFSYSVLFGIAATVVGAAYLVGAMTVGVWRFRERMAESDAE